MRNPGYAAAPPRSATGTLDSLDLARALLNAAPTPNARIAWKEIPFDRDLGTVRSPPGISIGRNWLSFVGATPFYLAAKGADLPLMRLLVEHGADPKPSTVQNVTPLMAAAGLGFWDGESPGPESGVPESQALEAVKLALELGNDVNAVTDYGETQIAGDPRVLLHRHPLNLGDFGENALGDMRWGGSTALHGAALRGADIIVKFLVEQGRARRRPEQAGVDAADRRATACSSRTPRKRWPTTVALLQELEGRRPESTIGSRPVDAAPSDVPGRLQGCAVFAASLFARGPRPRRRAHPPRPRRRPTATAPRQMFQRYCVELSQLDAQDRRRSPSMRST